MKLSNFLIKQLLLIGLVSTVFAVHTEEDLKNGSFTCHIFKAYLNSKTKEFEIVPLQEGKTDFEFSCTDDNSVAHIMYGTTESKKLVIEIRFGEYEVFGDNGSKSVYCFELVSYFSAKNYNYYQCSPAPSISAIQNFANEEVAKKDILAMQKGEIDIADEGYKQYIEYFTELDTLYEFMTGELNNMVSYIKDKMEPAAEGEDDKVIEPSTVLKFLNLIKFTGGANLSIGDEAGAHLHLIPASEKPEGLNKVNMEGTDGYAFEYSFAKNGEDKEANLLLSSFCRFTGMVYRSSPNYLRLVISSAVKEYDLYVSRYLLTKQGSDQGAMDFLLETYGKQLNDIITEILGVAKPGKGGSFFNDVFKLTDDINATNVNVMSMPLAAVAVNDVILGTKTPDNGVTRIAVPLYNKQYKTFLIDHKMQDSTNVLYTYDFDPDPTAENPNLTLETMEIENYFVKEEGKVPALGAVYKDLDASKFTVIDFNEDLNPVNLYKHVNNLHNNMQDNFVILGYAIQGISRKVYVKLTTFRHEFYRSVNLKFITQFFISEFLVPWSGFEDFKQSVNQVFSKVRKHYEDQVSSSKKKQKTKLDPFWVYEQLNTLTKTYNVCMIRNKDIAADAVLNPETLDCEVPDGKACKVFEIYVNKVDRETARSDQNNIPECAKDADGTITDKVHYQKVIVLNKKEMDGHGMFSLVISEPLKPGANAVVKDVSSSYDFFENYPYDNKDVFVAYMKECIDGADAPAVNNVGESAQKIVPKKKELVSGEQPIEDQPQVVKDQELDSNGEPIVSENNRKLEEEEDVVRRPVNFRGIGKVVTKTRKTNNIVL